MKGIQPADAKHGYLLVPHLFPRDKDDTTDYINFKSLGYEGDPIIHGGRFKKLPMGYKPAGQ